MEQVTGSANKMETEHEKPSQSACSVESCWDASSPPSDSNEALVRTKRQRRAPKPYEPEPDTPKRRRAANNKQPVRDSDGRFVKRTSSSPRKRGAVSTHSTPTTPTRDMKGRFLKADSDNMPVHVVPDMALIPTSSGHCMQNSERFAQNFLDSILNFPDDEADSESVPQSSVQESESAVSEDLLTCATSKNPPARVEVPIYLTRSFGDEDCGAVPFASNLPGMDDFLYVPSPDEDIASYDAWTVPVSA